MDRQNGWPDTVKGGYLPNCASRVGSPGDDQDAVTDGHEFRIDARVRTDQAGQFLDRGDGGVQGRVDRTQGDAPSVVHQQPSARSQKLQRAMIVVDVVSRVRVNENEIEWASQGAQSLPCRPHEYLDLCPMGAPSQTLTGERGQAGINLTGQHRAVLREHLGHRERAETVKRADLQHAPGPDLLNHCFEEGRILHSPGSNLYLNNPSRRLIYGWPGACPGPASPRHECRRNGRGSCWNLAHS